ncbi:4-hydroxybenzoate polyprenyltransferase [Sanguibacter antarcticus]|uniref:4-hydroxybenzoate polyprenyltransferase n=2 Tax=Sanguibacter antarcticus TaxID=372484 RepID=A0A2A9E4B1_9MICO|nr:UbiA family prenyltransferase [Sanguibacter antarcticus]PFG33195.1 4-hydroxybenzoate polyprenyltransferase [Sanguibacter antarcticus]
MLARATTLALSSHPGPTLAVTLLSAVLGVAVGMTPLRVFALALAIAAGQLSIGLSNDWIDADRDTAVGRTDKPVAQGLVTVATVRTAAFASLTVSLLVSFALGLAAGTAHLVFIASAWAYNAGLKRTVFSVVPFVVSFGLLPTIVTLALPDPATAAPWAIAVGAVFGVSIHFTNVLPDLVDDARTGIAGLPHRLGRVTAGVVAFVALAVAAVLVVVGARLDTAGGPSAVVAVVGLVASLSIAGWGTVLVVTRPPSRLLFRLVVVASLLIAVQLGLGGTRLVA